MVYYVNMNYIETSDAIRVMDGPRHAGEIAFAINGNGDIILDHTIVEPDYRGRGVGTELVRRIVELARRDRRKIVSMCPFARAVFARHPEYRDVLIFQGE